MTRRLATTAILLLRRYSDSLATPPTPSEVEYDGYVPEPCVLAPEQITEYPDFLELPKYLQQQLADWSTWQAADVAVDDSYEIARRSST